MIYVTLVFLGIVNWLGTTLIVDSELFRPLREWVGRQEQHSSRRWSKKDKRPLTYDELLAMADAFDGPQKPSKREAFWHKMSYLVGCQLCCGVWVGFAIALVTPDVRPFGAGIIGLVLVSLAIKAIGHTWLEFTAMMKRAASRHY